MRRLTYGLDGEILVDLEFAKYLKSIGFSKATKYFWQDKDLPYSEQGLKWNKGKKKLNNNRFDDWIYSAPTVEDAIVWLLTKTPEFAVTPEFELFKDYFSNQEDNSVLD